MTLTVNIITVNQGAPSAPEIPSNPPMPKNTTRKPRGKYQQYDLKFKKKAVASLKEARTVKGGVKALCALLQVSQANLYYWEALSNKGILKKANAVAFSHNPQNIRRG